MTGLKELTTDPRLEVDNLIWFGDQPRVYARVTDVLVQGFGDYRGNPSRVMKAYVLESVPDEKPKRAPDARDRLVFLPGRGLYFCGLTAIWPGTADRKAVPELSGAFTQQAYGKSNYSARDIGEMQTYQRTRPDGRFYFTQAMQSRSKIQYMATPIKIDPVELTQLRLSR